MSDDRGFDTGFHLYGKEGGQSLFAPRSRSDIKAEELLTPRTDETGKEVLREGLTFSVKVDEETGDNLRLEIENYDGSDTTLKHLPEEPLWMSMFIDLPWEDVRRLRDYLTFILAMVAD